MRCLLDSHALLWLLDGDPRLSAKAREVVADASNELGFGRGSYWEICIKVSLGKLRLRAGWPEAIAEAMQDYGIRWWGVETAHAEAVVSLPFLHRDPFDRLMVAQAMVEDLTILSADPQIRAYAVPVIW